MPSLPTITDYEKSFLLQMLGGAALPTDSLTTLRYKFYKGVVEGTISIGGISSIPLRTGEFIRPPGQYSNGAFALAANTVAAVPIFIPAGNYASIAADITTAGAAGALLRLGIYDGDTLIKDYGTVAGDTTGLKTIASALTIAASKWFLAVAVHQGVTTTAIQLARADHPQSAGFGIFTGSDMKFSPGGALTYGTTQSGALPATIPGTRTAANHGPGITLARAA